AREPRARGTARSERQPSHARAAHQGRPAGRTAGTHRRARPRTRRPPATTPCLPPSRDAVHASARDRAEAHARGPSLASDMHRIFAMDERLERYAELAVRVGANVQPGQEVFVLPMVEHADLGRALVRQAYEAGASYVAPARGALPQRASRDAGKARRMT